MKRVDVLVLAVGLTLACDRLPETSAEAVVRRGVLTIEVEVEGSLRAADSARVGPPSVTGVWSFQISMMQPEGATVSPGDPILAFDTSELERRLATEQAIRDSAAKELEMRLSGTKVSRRDGALALAEAEAALHKVELKADAPPEIDAFIELEKLRLDLELARKQVAHLARKAEITRDTDAAAIERLRSKRDRADARVQEIEAAIAQMVMTATRAGTVIYESNWRGEKKKVGESTWLGETVMHVASLDRMEAEGEVDEVDAAKLALDQEVSLRLDAAPDVELHGRVREISRTVQRQSPENPLKIVKLRIALDEAEGVRLLPGMRFRGHIVTEVIEDVLVAPIDAIEPSGAGPVALRRRGQVIEPVRVELGRRDAERVEVRSGVDEGDVLVVSTARPDLVRPHAGEVAR